MFHYIVSNWVAFGAFVFGLYWMLQSLCIRVFYRSRVFVLGVKEIVYFSIVSLPGICIGHYRNCVFVYCIVAALSDQTALSSYRAASVRCRLFSFRIKM